MKEEMDGKVVYFPPESAFQSFNVLMTKVLLPTCTLIWRANDYSSRQVKV